MSCVLALLLPTTWLQALSISVLGYVYFPDSPLRFLMIAVGTTLVCALVVINARVAQRGRECRDKPDLSVLEEQRHTRLLHRSQQSSG
jgi:hypothetical protein